MAFAAPGMGSEETAAAAEARYGQEGFRGQFAVRPGGRVACLTCQQESDARRVSMLALHRLEGSSDPGDELVVAALQCPACDARGTLTLAYGSMAPRDDSLALARLVDDRRLGGIQPGI